MEEKVGLLRVGSISHFNEADGTVDVKLDYNTSLIKGQSGQPINITVAYPLFYNNGVFIGAKPVPGTPVVIGQGSGNQYFIVSTLPKFISKIPTLEDDELIIQTSNDNRISLVDDFIKIGSQSTRLNINSSELSYASLNFDNNYSFTQATRNVTGLVKRDLSYNVNFDQESKLDSDLYEEFFVPIGLDNSLSINNLTNTNSKNPGLTESRKLVYEFANKSNVLDDVYESSLYSKQEQKQKTYNLPNRRISKSDTLSLSLLAPNYLMESVQGTVVDIFGNVLDINRYPLPIGKNDATLGGNSENNSDKSAAFLKIKDLYRKSLAYHFELNARKELRVNNQIRLPDINSTSDYARDRSRLFIDIDKEGQFKINIPASSEKGNISYLTRYENYSSFGDEDNNNPNKLIYRDDKFDIFHDSFASKLSPRKQSSDSTRGVITVLNDSVQNSPVDRITTKNLKYGTAYHDVTDTCVSHLITDFVNYELSEPKIISMSSINTFKQAVSSTIIQGVNAGGRSGTINLDGSIDLNIGANTIDRHSIWLDTAGGIVGNIGRDRNNNSTVLSMDGNFILQVGGFGVDGDSRFKSLNNSFIGGVIDVRVFNSGRQVTMLRIDNNGVTLMTPSQMKFYSVGDMIFKSDSNMKFEAENMYVQERLVLKESGGSV